MIWSFFIDFHINTQYLISVKSDQWASCRCVRTDGRTWKI